MAGSSRRSVLLVVIVIFTCGAFGALFGQRIGNGASGSDTEIRDSLRTFSTVYDLVEQNYADKVSADKAIYNGAIPGMLRALDPHSNFFDPKSYSLLREEQRGKYYGVGMQVGPRNNKVIVIAPFVGTPAYRRQAHGQHDHQRSRGAVERPQGHHGAHHDAARGPGQAAGVQRGTR
jgi:carboxyl-terminal processing protease